MSNLSLTMRILFWFLAAIAGIIFAIAGNELSKNIIHFITRKGRPPLQRPFHVWIIFLVSFAASIWFSVVASSEIPPTRELMVDSTTAITQEIRPSPVVDSSNTLTVALTYEETETIVTAEVTAQRVSATISCEVPQVNLRRSPGYINKDDSDVIVKVDCGQEVEILGENQNADDLTWWKVSWNGFTGWMADHSSRGNMILIFNR